MIEFKLNAESIEGYVNQIQQRLGGTMIEKNGEFVLNFDNEFIKGYIKLVTFDWGVSLTDHNYICFDDILFVSDTSIFNPIHFIYCSKGSISQRFDNENEFNVVHEHHSSILTSQKNEQHYALFPKNQQLEVNVISIVRTDFLKRRLSNVEQLNQKLHDVLVDENELEGFSYYSPMHIKMDDFVIALRNISTKGMTRMLQIEGQIYHLLSMHLEMHDKYYANVTIPNTLLKSDLKTIRQCSQQIFENPSLDYSLEQLAKESGLSQVKLQDGFKFLYLRTVTEYIRHIRLEAAKELMGTTDLNISQIVYSIGLTSRSYFSKIFKEKYGITPNGFKNQILIPFKDDL